MARQLQFEDFWQMLAASKADSEYRDAVTAGEPARCEYAFQQAFGNFYQKYPILIEENREKALPPVDDDFYCRQLLRDVGVLGIQIPVHVEDLRLSVSWPLPVSGLLPFFGSSLEARLPSSFPFLSPFSSAGAAPGEGKYWTMTEIRRLEAWLGFGGATAGRRSRGLATCSARTPSFHQASRGIGRSSTVPSWCKFHRRRRVWRPCGLRSADGSILPSSWASCVRRLAPVSVGIGRPIRRTCQLVSSSSMRSRRT